MLDIHSSLTMLNSSFYWIIKCTMISVGWFIVFNVTLNIFLNYIVVVSFIGDGNRSTWRKPPICRKSLTNFIT